MPTMAQNDLTVPVREPGDGGIDAGDTRTAKVTSIDTRTVEKEKLRDADEDVLYLDLEMQDTEVDYPFSAGFSLGPVSSPGVSEQTELGGVLTKFGADLTIGDDLDLGTYLGAGTMVAFEVEMDEADDGNEYPRCDKGTLRPADAGSGTAQGSLDSATDDAGGADDDVKEQVLAMVEDMEGQSKNDVKKALVREDGDHLPAFKELVASGGVEVTGDDVVLLG